MEINGIDRERFGTFVAELRKEKGWTQQELADKLYVSNKAVSKWERGQSLPDVELLLPLSRVLGISVTELLSAQRIPAEEPIRRNAVDRLMEVTVEHSVQQNQTQRLRKWVPVWICSTALALIEFLLLSLVGGILFDRLTNSVLVVEVICLILGAWACFFARETLPVYYDQNKISSYSQGPFRMNLPGVHFNNSNWPHILRTIRLWTLMVAAAYPLFWWGCIALNQNADLLLCLAACLGLFIPICVVAKKYE